LVVRYNKNGKVGDVLSNYFLKIWQAGTDGRYSKSLYFFQNSLAFSKI